MQIESQTVSIDFKKEKTHLDKEATNIVGNLLKQRDSLESINKDQQKLIDSLRLESRRYKAEADTLRGAYANLKFSLREKEIQLKNTIEKNSLKTDLFQSDLKALRRKRLGLGLSLGDGLANEGQSPFAGVSINYTLFRF